MNLKVGGQLPDGALKHIIDGVPSIVDIAQLFANKKGILFAVPGAFTPGCTQTHLPSYISKFDAIKAKGFDIVACMAVNDAWVMDAWAKETGAIGKIHMLADGSAEYTKKLNMVLDLTEAGLGLRCKRFSMIIDHGTIESINIDEKDISSTTAGPTCGLA